MTSASNGVIGEPALMLLWLFPKAAMVKRDTISLDCASESSLE